MSNISSAKVQLRNGVMVPSAGFGTFKISNEDVYGIVLEAIKAGYRHIDTAAYYGNEEGIGRAVRDSGIGRDELFITSKVWHTEDSRDLVIKAFEKSEKLLGRIDLYLIHWPRSRSRLEVWKTLTELQDQGRIRAAGVSNYMVKHLEEIRNSGLPMPLVDQVEFSPFLYKKALLEFCRSENIVLEAYSPLTRGKRLDDKTVGSIAEKHGKTPAQIMLRWVLQKDMMLIAKTMSPERMRENASLFDFSLLDDEMKKLDSLNEEYHTTWNPEEID